MSDQSADVTAEELAAVGDTNPEPADASQLTERTQPYFLDDAETAESVESATEVAEALDDAQFTGPEEA
jgi:hypothetical protein